jgi:hypothetical protein
MEMKLGKIIGYMRAGLIAGFAAVALGVVFSARGGIANAAEARPWLCRDKPVFSSSKPVRYEAKNREHRRWQLFFMQFVAGGPHDGFATVASADVGVSSDAEGRLGSGQYFAVALYLGKGGHWVCPGSAREAEKSGGPGVVSELCYGGDDSESCGMRLTIRR